MLSLTSNGKYKTTTWDQRNKDQIVAVAELCQESSPSLIAIGPGGILPVAGSLSIYGKQTDNIITSSARILVQMLESGIRKTGAFSLESFETSEILSVFAERGIIPNKTVVIDIEQKVLDAVKKSSVMLRPICKLT